MLYLSSLGIVHRDLASRNILLKEDLDDDQRRRFVAKVSDFGLSRVVTPQEGYYRSESGLMPIQWSAPEALRHKRFSTKTGIWSYGVLLWEIFSGGAEPYNGLTCPELRTHIEGGGRLSPSRPRAPTASTRSCCAAGPRTARTGPRSRRSTTLSTVSTTRRRTSPRRSLTRSWRSSAQSSSNSSNSNITGDRTET